MKSEKWDNKRGSVGSTESKKGSGLETPSRNSVHSVQTLSFHASSPALLLRGVAASEEAEEEISMNVGSSGQGTKDSSMSSLAQLAPVGALSLSARPQERDETLVSSTYHSASCLSDEDGTPRTTKPGVDSLKPPREAQLSVSAEMPRERERQKGIDRVLSDKQGAKGPNSAPRKSMAKRRANSEVNLKTRRGSVSSGSGKKNLTIEVKLADTVKANHNSDSDPASPSSEHVASLSFVQVNDCDTRYTLKSASESSSGPSTGSGSSMTSGESDSHSKDVHGPSLFADKFAVANDTKLCEPIPRVPTPTPQRTTSQNRLRWKLKRSTDGGKDKEIEKDKDKEKSGSNASLAGGHDSPRVETDCAEKDSKKESETEELREEARPTFLQPVTHPLGPGLPVIRYGLDNFPTTIHVTSETLKKYSKITKELFFLDKNYYIPPPLTDLPPLIRMDEELVSIENNEVTIISRTPEWRMGFSILAILKERNQGGIRPIMEYPARASDEEDFTFFFATELERVKFGLIPVSNAVRSHWVIADSKRKEIKSINDNEIVPLAIITTIIVNDEVLFLETSSNPRLERPYFEMPVGQFLESRPKDTAKPMFASIDTKKIKAMVERVWKQPVTRLPDCPHVVDILTKIEMHKKVVLENVRIGVFYRKAKQYTRADMHSNKTTSDDFNEFMTYCGYNNKENAQWRHLSVTWFLAPLEDEDGLRQKIGNSMFIIIYNDCDEPFNPSNVYLGQITTVVCVVQKTTVLDTLLDPAVPKYRLSFYFCFDSKTNIDDLTVCMDQIEAFNAPPHFPANYVFTPNNVFDAIIVKFTNSLTPIINKHPQFGGQFYTPIAFFIEKIVKENLPVYYNKIVEMRQKKKKKKIKSRA